MNFSSTVLDLDCSAEADRVAASIRTTVLKTLRRRGAVVAVSGGIDSALCATLCVRALGKENVHLLFLPERHSSPISTRLGKELAAFLKAEATTEDISGTLEASGCYTRQMEAIRMAFPEFQPGWKFKLVLPSILQSDRLNLSRVTVEMPGGELRTERLSHHAYLQLVAATNFKQRTRKMLEYYHADRLNYAVCGTPNRLEYDLGFFVKGGDGLADFKPIAHLYKTQVYAMARALGVPVEICSRTPTTDTFPLAQTQEEFYFSLSYEKMDLCLFAYNHNLPAAEVAPHVGLSPEQIERVFADIESKRRTTVPLHLHSLLSAPVREVEERISAAKSGG
jgi:NAD+ synthase